MSARTELSDDSPIHDPEPPPAADDAPDLIKLDRGVLSFFHRSRWNLVAAAAVTSPVVLAVTWPLSSHANMLWFLALHQIAVMIMALTFALPTSARFEGRFPPLAVAGLVLAQSLLSGAMFFDAAAARNADFAFGIAIVLYAFAAGTVATLGPLRRAARITLVCLFGPYIVACFAYGHPGLALGTIFFLVMIAGIAVEKTAQLFEELITLRHAASNRADKAEAIATTDALTGLTNRYGLTMIDGELLQKEISGIFIDLDKFKEVNDSLGHRAGDEVLVEVARRLRRYVRPSDTVARLGGDEFFILLWSDHQIPVMDIANRICEAVERPIEVEGGVAQVSASIGLSRQNPGMLSLDALIQSADEALYMAKSLGRNQVFASSVRLNEAAAKPTPPPTERSEGFPGRN